MEPGDACPEPSRLRALFDGSLPEGEEPALARHLDDCAPCRGQLDRWAAESDVLAGLTPRVHSPPGPALGHVLDRLKADPHGGGPAPTIAEVDLGGNGARRALATATAATEVADGDGEPPLDFLAPTDRPGGLGRIGPYEVVGRVGHGGMGVVLKAIDPALDRVVAVKVLAPAYSSSALARRRFLREARAAAAVCHEHVVTIHAVDEAGGLPYLVMQFVAGRSLQEKIDRDGPLGLRETLRIGMQVAAGLAAAHEQGLVHRDIKPANILLENGVERAKITDFGLALAADDARLTRSGTIAGTPSYMAPEQARGEPVDARTDLFSLGSVLYAMVTGEAPFAAESTLAVLRGVSDDPPRPVRALNPEAPAWLAELIDRLMAKDPAARPQTAGAVADLLGRRLAEVQGHAPAAAPAGARRSGGGGRLRAGGRIVLIVAAMAAVAAVAAVGFHAGRRRPEPAPRPGPAPSPVSAAVAARRLEGEGWGLVGRGDLGRAFERFSEALRLDPACVMALLGRGDIYGQRGDWTRALADCDEAIRLDPGGAAGYDVRGKVRAMAGQFAAAVADCDRSLQIEPDRPYPYLHRGSAYNGLQLWDRAIADFDEAIRRVPGMGWAFHHRATAYQKKGDLERALDDAGKAVALDPGNTGFRAQRGIISCWKLEPDRALPDLEEAIRLEPGNPVHYHERGWAHALRHDYDRAVADYTRALRDRPRDVVMLNDRASAYALSGRYKEAEADFAEALRIDGSSPWGLVRRAQYVHAARGDHDRAVADCDAVLRVMPDYGEALLNRGLALLARGEPARAVADLDRVLALGQGAAPTFEGLLSVRYPALYRARGEARRQLGQLDDAAADLDEALRKSPYDTETLFRRSLVHAAREDHARALADLDRAIRLGRDDPETYQARGDARARLGDADGAKADRERAERLRAKAPG